MATRNCFRFDFVVFFLFVATIISTSTAKPVCFTNGAGGCYRLVFGSTWENAAANCAELGGTLATVDSAAKTKAMSTFLYAMWGGHNIPVISHEVFTAGRRLVQGDCTSPFHWKPSGKTNTPVKYANWEPEHPKCTTQGNCLKVVVGTTMKWKALDCAKGMIGVCDTNS